jgi:RNA polymerase sigma-70 factor, ECF subfamily
VELAVTMHSMPPSSHANLIGGEEFRKKIQRATDRLPYHKEHGEVTLMRKPAESGADPTARGDEVSSARRSDVRGDERPTGAEAVLFTGSHSDDFRNDVNLSDAWLVEHARHGDQQAFALLVRRYEKKLLRVLTRLIRDPEYARDLAQETFWRVYVRLDRFDTARRFGPWLFRVAVNLGFDWIRQNKHKWPRTTSIKKTGVDDYSSFEVTESDPRTQAELAQEVQFTLGLMPVSYRTILVLRDLEGFSSSEVAAIIGRRESTVRWKLAVARDKFREIWERRQDGVRRGPTDGKSRDEYVNE